MQNLGWSCQKPTKKAKQRQEAEIRYWKRYVWPHIKKAGRLGARLVFLDESGFLLVPTIVKTWSPKGKTPVLATAGHWTKVSAISAISISPQRKRLGLHIRFHSNKNIKAPETIGFLRHLLKHLNGPIVLLWDRGSIHKARPVKQFLESHPRVEAHHFPGYAPELNPDEFIWTKLKRTLANSVPNGLTHLKQLLVGPVRRLKNSQRLLWSCIQASGLPW